MEEHGTTVLLTVRFGEGGVAPPCRFRSGVPHRHTVGKWLKGLGRCARLTSMSFIPGQADPLSIRAFSLQVPIMNDPQQ